jgi:hypothetical protein
VTGTALLLEDYRDGELGLDPSDLCEGCHGIAPGGGTPHPMTLDPVTRTGNTLITTASLYLRPQAEIASESRATFPGADLMNCDSCHQPHDADSQGGTYIYDSGEGIVPLLAIEHDVTNTGQTETDPWAGTPARSGNIVQIRGVDMTGLSDENFCDSCHFYTD